MFTCSEHGEIAPHPVDHRCPVCAAKSVQPLPLPPDMAEAFEKLRERNQRLLASIKAALPKLKELLERMSAHDDDMVYRFYHGSFKVYSLQACTVEIVDTLKKLAPDAAVDEQFMEIYRQGTGKTFEMSHNHDWGLHTRPIVEAYMHAKMFLETAIRYGEELEEAGNCFPGGWGLVLYFYGMR